MRERKLSTVAGRDHASQKQLSLLIIHAEAMPCIKQSDCAVDQQRMCRAAGRFMGLIDCKMREFYPALYSNLHECLNRRADTQPGFDPP
jgi:hypothetical protein